MEWNKLLNHFKPKYAWYRQRVRPGLEGKYRIVIQRASRFPFLIVHRWNDCVPIDNYVRGLEHEALALWERLSYIIEHEHGEAEKYVKQSFKDLAEGHLHKGRGTPFRDAWVDHEELMPNVSDSYKEMVKAYRQCQDPKVQGGTSTVLLLPEHRHFHNQEVLGEKFDSTLAFRYPRGNNPNQQGGRKKGGPNQNQQ